MKSTTLAKLENKLRPLITKLPSQIVISKYSKWRLNFLARLKEEVVIEPYIPPENLGKNLWGIGFLSPLMNSAGMFKNGECYEMTAKQGASAYLGGTGTWNPRKGNEKNGIYLPFVPYPRSKSASNWLGLPNDGDEFNSKRAEKIKESINIPLGWSVMGSPDLKGEEKLEYLVKGMKLYEKSVDFIEINESCPNTAYYKPLEDNLASRLKYVKENFLDRRRKKLPVIVKFSNDTNANQLSEILDLLFEIGYDGVNFGNTSTSYAQRREKIDLKERKLFDFYINTFGGGVSGKPLKESSLELASLAVEYIKKGKPSQEFHVIRTGGIESLEDIKESERAGISLNQWYTGYFENFARFGHNVYRKLFESY